MDAEATIFERLIALLSAEHARGHLSVYRMVPIASTVLGSRVAVGNASRFIYAFAKGLGYNIPPYPLAGSGEIKQFFADEGVANVPEWYAKIGVTDEEYARLHEYTIVSVRGQGADRTALLLHLYLRNWPAFCGLEESGITHALPGPALVELIDAILDAALSTANTPTVNPTITVRRLPL